MDRVAGVAPAMPKGGGGGFGGNGGDGADMVSVAQLRRLLGLQGGGAQGGSGGGKGAGSRRPRERRDRRLPRPTVGGEGGGVERREGDWQCGSCSFSPNFAWKARCFRCGTPKSRDPRAASDRVAATRSSGTMGGKGPVGAGGSRPLLSTFATRAAAAAAGMPSYRPMGSSVAARAAARASGDPVAAGDLARHQGPRQMQQPSCPQQQWHQHIGGAQSPAQVAPSDGKGGGSQGITSAPPSTATGGKGRPRWADEELPCDRVDEDDEDAYMDADVDEADAALDEDEGDEEGYEDITPEQLRQSWLAECRAVKSLESQGRHAGSAALAAARQARDEAEASWRSAIGPAPVSVRMGRAQQRLDKAAKALERCRLDLEEFEDEADKQRAALRQRIDDAEERYRARAVQLDELHAEAGELATGSTTSHSMRRAESEVCNMVAADLQALVETLPEDSDARGSVNLILAKMSCAASSAGPQRYNIGDAMAGERDGTKAGAQCTGGKADEDVHWSEDASGRWCRRATAAAREKSFNVDDDGWQRPRRPIRLAGGKGQGHGSSTPGAASSGWNAAVSGGGARTADAGDGNDDGGKTAAGSRGDSGTEGGPNATAATATATDAGANRKEGEQIGQRRKREGDDDADTYNKSHRGEDIVRETSVELGGDDAARAEKLQKEQAIAIWAARNAQSIFGDDASRAIAGQLYAHKVQLVRQRAQDVGVDPKAEDGRDLLELEPEEFTRWTQAVLEPAEKKACGDNDL